jgi:hypothetical protein
MLGVQLSYLVLIVARNKTKTIKERTLHIYLPSIEMVDEWKRLAENEGMSLSKFVQEHVQDNLLQQDEGYESRISLIQTNQKLMEENEKFRSRVEMLETVVSKLDDELKSYRRMPFEEGTEGERTFNKRLLSLFRENKEVSYDDVHALLGIDPRDTKAVKGIEAELDAMVDYGLVKETRNGWRWTI